MSARPLRPAEQTAVARFSTIVAEAYGIVPELDPEQAIAALGELERVRVKLLQMLSVPATADALLTAEQACGRLGISPSALYRRHWPFRVECRRAARGTARRGSTGSSGPVRGGDGSKHA